MVGPPPVFVAVAVGGCAEHTSDDGFVEAPVGHDAVGGDEVLVAQVRKQRFADEYHPVGQVDVTELAGDPVGEVQDVVPGVELDVGPRVRWDHVDDLASVEIEDVQARA